MPIQSSYAPVTDANAIDVAPNIANPKYFLFIEYT
jgi:hypothetical protein